MPSKQVCRLRHISPTSACKVSKVLARKLWRAESLEVKLAYLIGCATLTDFFIKLSKQKHDADGLPINQFDTRCVKPILIYCLYHTTLIRIIKYIHLPKRFLLRNLFFPRIFDRSRLASSCSSRSQSSEAKLKRLVISQHTGGSKKLTKRMTAAKCSVHFTSASFYL